MKKCRYIHLLWLATCIICSCKQEQLDWSKVITFTNPNPATIPADGYSALTLTAHIAKDADPDKKTITFTTDYGTFNNGTNTIIVTADQNGNATTYLKGTTVITATVKATVQTTFLATESVYFTAPDPNTVFTIAAVKDSVPADGVSTFAIMVTVNKKLLTTTQSIVFTTDAGTFTNNSATTTLTTDATGAATAYLKGTIAGPVHLIVASNMVTQYDNLNFAVAYPDTLLISSQPALLAGIGNSLAITVNLKRKVGVSSPGFYLGYAATDKHGKPIGIFSSETISDASGNASAAFSEPDTSYKGVVHLQVSVKQKPTIKSLTDITIH